MTGGTLEDRLLAAHARGDGREIGRAYAEAADLAEAAGELDRAAFFLTHAWIFALEAGDAAAGAYRSRLAHWGRVDGEDG